MNGSCSVPPHRCSHVGPGVAGHHVLGREADGEYVQPEILLALCQPDCHQRGVHLVLRSQGLDGPMEATPGVLIGRIGVNLAWLAWDKAGEVTLPCLLLGEIADVLIRIGDELRGMEDSCP